jgi:hypothetical protein
MDLTKALFSGIAATSVMTAFSYMISGGKLKNHKEPELLASMVENAWPYIPKSTSRPAGWAAHYAFGLAWALVHEMVLDKTSVKRNARTGLLFGSLGGLTGVIIWELLFRANPKRPNIDYRSFYTHLLVAQIIFSTTFLLLNRESHS